MKYRSALARAALRQVAPVRERGLKLNILLVKIVSAIESLP